MEKKTKTLDKLLNDYFQNEEEWSKIIKKYYVKPGRFFKSHKYHRVFKFKNKIVKIQFKSKKNKIPYEETVQNEYLSYQAMRNRLGFYNAKLKNLNKNWTALEVNFFEGEILEDLLEKKSKLIILWFHIIFKLIYLSLLGIYHKQLRLRHFIVNKKKKLHLIDFGGSQRVNVITAFIKNFGILNLKTSKAFYMLKQVLFYKSKGKINNNNFNSKNIKLYKLSKSENLTVDFNKMNEDQVCIYIGKLLIDNAGTDSTLFRELPSFYLGNFAYLGNWLWEPVRRCIFNSIQLNSSKIMILGSGIGLLPMFLNRFNNKLVAYEKNYTLRKIANSIYKNFNVKQRIKNQPNNIVKLMSNFEYIICFDLSNKIKLNKILPKHKNFLKFIYITKLSQYELDTKYSNYYKFNLIIVSDVNIYEILY